MPSLPNILTHQNPLNPLLAGLNQGLSWVRQNVVAIAVVVLLGQWLYQNYGKQTGAATAVRQWLENVWDWLKGLWSSNSSNNTAGVMTYGELNTHTQQQQARNNNNTSSSSRMTDLQRIRQMQQEKATAAALKAAEEKKRKDQEERKRRNEIALEKHKRGGHILGKDDDADNDTERKPKKKTKKPTQPSLSLRSDSYNPLLGHNQGSGNLYRPARRNVNRG